MIAFRDLEPRRLISQDGAQAAFDPEQAAHRLILNDGMTQKCATLDSAGLSVNSRWLVYPQSNVVSAKVRVFMDVLIEHTGRSPAWAER
ncbi:hypothetical protein [Ascidiaceihabitans sp.]|uniref:hypothetical protein n=1 Tax=Ascidiaceihabitans sp. TaxID=1872644 RepID=UPI0032996A63